MTYTFSSLTLPAATSRRGGPLSYQIMASIVSGKEFSDKIIITQDEIDQLRQEYIDISKRTEDREYKGALPPIGAFTNSVRSEFNSSDYNYWIVNWQINLPDKFDDLEANYGSDIGLTSAYRNPAKQLTTGNNTGNANSFHVYGRAIDYDQGTGTTGSEENYNVYSVAETIRAQTGITENFLYDQNSNLISPPYPAWPQMPSGVTEYRHGHVGW